MKDEIKEILDNVKKCCDITKDQSFTVYQRQDILAILDYITNLQEKYDKALTDLVHESHKRMELESKITNLQEENERLKEIAKKMHLWIFLHSGDEQKVYDELGLTDEENAILGYSGQFKIGEDKK